MTFPPSLAVVPNIPWEKQTIEELEAEFAWWDEKVKSATMWGASLKAASDFREGCKRWLDKRRSELNERG